MHKTAATMVTIAALGTAAAVAYGCMKPAAKQQLKRDMRNTAKDVESVKDENRKELKTCGYRYDDGDDWNMRKF